MKIEYQERRAVEKARLPRTAKRVDATRLEAEMEELGIEFDDKKNVRITLRFQARGTKKIF